MVSITIELQMVLLRRTSSQKNTAGNARKRPQKRLVRTMGQWLDSCQISGFCAKNEFQKATQKREMQVEICAARLFAWETQQSYLKDSVVTAHHSTGANYLPPPAQTTWFLQPPTRGVIHTLWLCRWSWGWS